MAAVIPPGGLAATASGPDLLLSFPTTTPNYYEVQASPDLVRWTNCLSGAAGDGTMKTLTMANALTAGQGFYRLSILKPVSLILPQSAAFGFLGHSCGGIQEKVSAGFDPTNGYPTGVVNLSTRCGGSGRGGGYHTTTYTASVQVTWDFAGNVISASLVGNSASPGPTTPTDSFGDVIVNYGSLAYLVVPVPSAPGITAATQSGDAFQVDWTPNGGNPLAIISSTLTATPVDSGSPALTATVTGPATTGTIASLQPQTVYQITVVNTTIGGSSQPSDPVSVATTPATIPPSVPANVVASWSNPDPTGSTDTILVTWQAADPGNSPVDQYLVTYVNGDTSAASTQTVSGTTFSAFYTVDFIPSWSITVQAHNAAGWGPASSPYNLGGL